jgi:pimeloyl-ACP methyl ester carboxylesterase
MERNPSMLSVPGGQLAYEVDGLAQAPLVVCVHGMGSNRHAFRLLTPTLVAAGFRVARLDTRGHGDSSPGWDGYDAERVAQDVLALVRHLGGPAVLIGSSIGSAAITFAAASAPGDVAGLVLVGATATPLRLNPFLRLAMRTVLASPRLWITYYRSLFKAGRPNDFREDTDRLLAQLRRPGRMTAVKGVLDPTSIWWTRRGGDVACPVLVVMGTRDPDFKDPAAEARTAVAAFETADLMLVEGAGHYPFLELPALTNPAIARFVGAATQRAGQAGRSPDA